MIVILWAIPINQSFKILLITILLGSVLFVEFWLDPFLYKMEAYVEFFGSTILIVFYLGLHYYIKLEQYFQNKQGVNVLLNQSDLVSNSSIYPFFLLTEVLLALYTFGCLIIIVYIHFIQRILRRRNLKKNN